MALATPGCDGGRPADHFAQQVVERAEDLAGLGVMRSLLLLELLLVALRAIERRDDDGDGRSVMLERVGLVRARRVTGDALDAAVEVRGLLLLLDDARSLLGVAGLAGRRLLSRSDRATQQPEGDDEVPHTSSFPESCLVGSMKPSRRS
jgi:hypothetical protein